MEYEVLTQILDDLPEVLDINGKSFKPKFDYGTQADLLQFLKLKKKGRTKTNTYPLVWLETPTRFEKSNNILTGTINLVLATNSKTDLTNRQRTERSFKQILDPLRESVVTAINAHSGARVSVNNQVITKYFNYENDTEKGATDVWDAMSYQIEIQINLDCVTEQTL